MLLSGPLDQHLAMKGDPFVQGSVKTFWWYFPREFSFFFNALLLQQGH